MKRRVGITPIPTDANVEHFLEGLRSDNQDSLDAVLSDMRKTIAQTEHVGEPVVFAYGKLLNYLASTEVRKPDLIRLLAAAIWELS